MASNARRNQFDQVVSNELKRTAFHSEQNETDLQRICFFFQTREQEWLCYVAQHSRGCLDVEYGFFESVDELQAYAVELSSSSLSFVAVSSFSVNLLWVWFHAALAHPRIYADLCDASLELTPEEYQDLPAFSQHPKSSDRQDLAMILAVVAIRFLTAHEMAHIRNGHLRYKANTGGALYMAERKARLSPARALLQQTLEMDADRTAVSLTLPLILGEYFDMRELISKSLPVVLHTLKDRLRHWMFAVYSLFRCMEAASDPMPLDEATHPPPMVRMTLIMEAVRELLEDKGIDPNSLIFDYVFLSAVRDGEHAHALVRDEPMDIAPLLAVASSKVTEHATKLLNHWHYVQALLKPFNRGESGQCTVSRS